MLAFVAIGIALRVVRHALNSPLWWNEAFLAVNFLKRGYADLLRPLDYGQVSPILFLWAEKLAVDTLGFSEATLRLVPLLASIAALLAFAHVAVRLAPGTAGTYAVAILAVAYHPIRLGAEVKPYATDLLVAVLILGLAAAWWRRPERNGVLWGLAAFSPIALGASHPAAFVAGGIWVGLVMLAWSRRQVRAIWPLAAFGLSTAFGFAGWYLLYTRAQGEATLDAMREYWRDAFPPLDSPFRLAAWLGEVHAGRMLAYPGGGDDGASVATLLLVGIGAVALIRSRRASTLLLLLAPFGLTLFAAAIRRHPYGGHPRVAQHLAPAICLLAGFGLAAALSRIGPGFRSRRWQGIALAGLLAIGVIPLAADARRPYRNEVENQARQFARSFWPAATDGVRIACLRGDLGVAPWESPDLDLPLFLCNRRIYQPEAAPTGPGRPADGPIFRYILYRSPRDPWDGLADWLDAMRASHRLRGQAVVPIPSAPGGLVRAEVLVLDFEPRPAAADRDRWPTGGQSAKILTFRDRPAPD